MPGREGVDVNIDMSREEKNVVRRWITAGVDDLYLGSRWVCGHDNAPRNVLMEDVGKAVRKEALKEQETDK